MQFVQKLVCYDKNISKPKTHRIVEIIDQLN